MVNVNQTLLVGNLVKDVQTQHTKSGLAYLRFTVAVDGPKNRDGQRRTDFASCVVFGNQADNLGKIGRKGQLIYINGRIRSGHFTDAKGNERYTMNVGVNNFEILSPRSKSSRPAPDQSPDKDDETAKDKFDKDSDEVDISDDDMPF